MGFHSVTLPLAWMAWMAWHFKFSQSAQTRTLQTLHTSATFLPILLYTIFGVLWYQGEHNVCGCVGSTSLYVASYDEVMRVTHS